jgi:hypothetical protein
MKCLRTIGDHSRTGIRCFRRTRNESLRTQSLSFNPERSQPHRSSTGFDSSDVRQDYLSDDGQEVRASDRTALRAAQSSQGNRNLEPLGVVRPVQITAMKYIYLTRGLRCLVDDEDFEWLSAFSWCAGYASKTSLGPRYYAKRGLSNVDGKPKTVYMHREIMNPPPGVSVDHCDRDTLNNCRFNLRVCSHRQNLCNVGKRPTNKSGFIGVSWNKDNRTWICHANDGKKAIYLGSYNTPIEAATVYDAFVKQTRGEFAVTNFQS